MQGLLSSVALALSLVVPLLLLGGLGRRILLKLVEYIKRNLDGSNKIKIKGTVVLMKKNVLSFNDFHAAVIDRIDELLGEMVSFELVSATVGDPNKGNRGKVGHLAYLGGWLRSMPALTAGESKFHLTFYWDKDYGVPGAVIVKNHHHNEFLLKSLTLEGVLGEKRVHFDCNSWVYPVSKYKYDRIFFTNKTYKPCETPEPLQQYREEELLHLRGEGVTGPLQKHDRVYDYAYYNDLGEPDKGLDYVRPVLGGSSDYPYPRRGRTGRPPTVNDSKTESRLSFLNLDIYVPRDERFGHLKMADFLGYAIKSLNQSLLPILKGALKNPSMEFKTFQDILDLYEGGLPLPDCPELNEIKNRIPLEMIKELVRTDGERLLRFPLPQIIQEDKLAWRTDEEFTREMLAGVNPLVIRRLESFSFSSNLHPKKQDGLTLNKVMSITEEHIKKKQDGLMLKKANRESRLFVVDYYDALMPYLNRINSGSNKIYASRTLLYLEDDGTLKPLAIELSRPHPDGVEHGSVSQVFTPSEHGVEGSMWQLAKAYATVNDSGYHQLVSHWLNTHAVMEPFVIATNRQLSVVHPIYKLLSPHYRDTMNINALARQTLINAGGILELTVFPGRYAMEMSSTIYKDWKFTEQGLPDDLIKRGVAVEDPPGSKNIRLLIRDYPFAVDGLAIWSAIERWVTKYCSIYYKDQAAVQSDIELQAWWKEIREVGHGDKKDEDWWPKMQTRDELIKICTTIIWVGSALHAAVNFGQYAYAGYMPNRPTISRRFMPEPDTAEYEELKKNPDGVFLKTITSQLQTILGVSLIEILSRHTSDEVYLGQRASPEWTTDKDALDAFKQFGADLTEIENQINGRNRDKSLKNRNGPARVDYTLLYPNTSDLTHIGGLTGKGIPNSVSI